MGCRYRYGIKGKERKHAYMRKRQAAWMAKVYDADNGK
jgi:hypothetical protein